MHPDAVARDKLFNMRMSEDEWDRLEKVANYYGLNAANLIRALLKTAERMIEQGQAFPSPLVAGVDSATPKRRKRS